MAKEIYFITTNTGKVLSLQNRVKASNVSIVQKELPLPEIQADTAEEIAIEKAKVAFSTLRTPLLVHDSAFHIQALGGFPGPYIKYTLSTIGIKGILKLLENTEDRRCYFKSALVYINEQGKVKSFKNEGTIGDGTIARTSSKGNSAAAWSSLWQICIPSWTNGKPLSEMTPLEIEYQEKNNDEKSEFAAFARWLRSQPNS